MIYKVWFLVESDYDIGTTAQYMNHVIDEGAFDMKRVPFPNGADIDIEEFKDES